MDRRVKFCTNKKIITIKYVLFLSLTCAHRNTEPLKRKNLNKLLFYQ
jgi:hypothetical protein